MDQLHSAAVEKASQEYWNEVWTSATNPTPLEFGQSQLDQYVNRRLHQYFSDAFADMPTPGMTLLEIGCARSIWLPYFAREFGFDVSGIDYSQAGCEQARQLLANAGVVGKITHTDVFAPPPELFGAFDVVVSFGVVEHFMNTATCLTTFAKFLKPGGLLITMIPNMVGWVGICQKWLNPPVFAIHVPLDRERLAREHQLAGLDVFWCEYFLSTNFAVCNLNGIEPRTLGWFIKRVALQILILGSHTVWVLEMNSGPFPARKPFAPYILCAAIKTICTEQQLDLT